MREPTVRSRSTVCKWESGRRKLPPKAVERIQELLPIHDYADTAKMLNKEGFKSAKGLPYNRQTVGYVVRSRGWSHRKGKMCRPHKAKS